MPNILKNRQVALHSISMLHWTTMNILIILKILYNLSKGRTTNMQSRKQYLLKLIERRHLIQRAKQVRYNMMKLIFQELRYNHTLAKRKYWNWNLGNARCYKELRASCGYNRTGHPKYTLCFMHAHVSKLCSYIRSKDTKTTHVIC